MMGTVGYLKTPRYMEMPVYLKTPRYMEMPVYLKMPRYMGMPGYMEMQLFHFNEKKELWKPGKPKLHNMKLWKALCKEKDIKI